MRRSFLIKKRSLPQLTKHCHYMVFFSYFSDKTAKDELKLLRVGNFLKFYIEKRSLKNNLKFQFAHRVGRNPKIKDKKLHNFSMPSLAKKKEN